MSAAQRVKVQAAMDAVKVRTRALGETLCRGRAGSRRCVPHRCGQPARSRLTHTVAAKLLGEIRYAHLAAHIEITPLLTPMQRAKYAELRGYGASASRHDLRHDKH